METTRFMKRHLGLIAVPLAFALLLTACGSAKPFNYVEIGETPAGPGLFSGEDGQFTVYRK